MSTRLPPPPSPHTAPRGPTGRLRRVVVPLGIVAGMLAGWSAMGWQKARKQAEAKEAIVQSGGQCYLNYQWDLANHRALDQPTPPAPWLRALLGNLLFDTVVAVDLRSTQQPDSITPWLPLLPQLRYFNAADTPLADAALAPLGRTTGLRHLDIQGTPVTDAGLQHLAQLHQLQFLSLARTAVTDQGLETLARFQTLRQLDLSDTGTSREARERLRQALGRCTIAP
jgi:hypothetical protein